MGIKGIEEHLDQEQLAWWRNLKLLHAGYIAQVISKQGRWGPGKHPRHARPDREKVKASRRAARRNRG